MFYRTIYRHKNTGGSTIILTIASVLLLLPTFGSATPLAHPSIRQRDEAVVTEREMIKLDDAMEMFLSRQRYADLQISDGQGGHALEEAKNVITGMLYYFYIDIFLLIVTILKHLLCQ
jgi:hypothetical protein